MFSPSSLAFVARARGCVPARRARSELARASRVSYDAAALSRGAACGAQAWCQLGACGVINREK